MRICYVCADSGVSLAKYNGSASHLRAIVSAFRELGHDVEVLLADIDGAESLGVPFRPIPRPAFARSLNGLGRRVTGEAAAGESMKASLRALRRLWINPGLESALDETIERFNPDLVYERHSPFCVAAPIVAARHRCAHVLEVNAPLAWEGARHRGQALGSEAELLENLAFEATSRVVAVSEELRDQLVLAGVDAGKIRVVPNGVDPRRFRVAGNADRSGAEELVLGFVGSLKAWHGVEFLTEAFESLAGEVPELHLLVVGDGPLGGHVAELQARLPNRVTWTGALPPDEIPAQLARMQIAVAPYPDLDRFYFSPLKVLEYMASGTAIIASAIGQLERLVGHGKSGLLVEPGNAQALAVAIRRLAHDPELRSRLGVQARTDAVERHAWSQRAAEILDFARPAAA